MDDDLPEEFDLIVVGTGLSESIVAAAASRIGKTVLHLDPNDFYGSTWASFNLDAFQNFITKSSNIHNDNDDENNLEITENCCNIINAEQKWFTHDDNDYDKDEKLDSLAKSIEETAIATDSNNSKLKQNENDENVWTKNKILKEFRKFNIDLVPKLLYCGGKLVKLLITSNICRYAEFRSIDKLCTIYNSKIQSVPCSRSDVFQTMDLKMIEKRLLMKLFSDCMKYQDKNSDEDDEDDNEKIDNKNNLKQSYNEDNVATSDDDNEIRKINDEFEKYKDKTFLQYLSDKKLTDKIIHCVLYSISMSNSHTSFKNGIKNIKNFLNSLNRYGNTPFLYPMYGCGEIPQDFCRLCAVFGGIYCLKRSINKIYCENIDSTENKMITMIKCNEQNIKVKNLVIGCNNIPNGLLNSEENLQKQKQINKLNSYDNNYCGGLSRGILVTSKPLGDVNLNSGGGGVNFFKLPPISDDVNDDGAFVIQLSHYSGTCPKGLYLIHITSKSISSSPELDIKPYVIELFNNKNNNADDNDSENKSSLNILYSAYFTISKCKQCSELKNQKYSNLYLTCGPFCEIDYDKTIENAYKIFRKIYPNDEFLPRAPDPDEIIIGNEDPTSIKSSDDDIVMECKEEEINNQNAFKIQDEQNDLINSDLIPIEVESSWLNDEKK